MTMFVCCDQEHFGGSGAVPMAKAHALLALTVGPKNILNSSEGLMPPEIVGKMRVPAFIFELNADGENALKKKGFWPMPA